MVIRQTLAAGIGLSAFFASVCAPANYGSIRYTIHIALTALLLVGLVFIFLGAMKVREAFMKAIPFPLKKGISVDIGAQGKLLLKAGRLAIITVPFTFSIVNGIALGMIACSLRKATTGHFREISPLALAHSAIFLLKRLFMSAYRLLQSSTTSSPPPEPRRSPTSDPTR